ncbi:dockerin type I repeat-containing protein, partial [Chloroflexota bacterium]
NKLNIVKTICLLFIALLVVCAFPTSLMADEPVGVVNDSDAQDITPPVVTTQLVTESTNTVDNMQEDAVSVEVENEGVLNNDSNIEDNSIPVQSIEPLTTLAVTRLPVVIVHEANDITGNSAVLSGELIDTGTASEVKVSIEWGETEEYGNLNQIKEAIASDESFSLTLPFLSPNTTYRFRAKAISDGTNCSEEKVFTTTGVTLKMLPSIESTTVDSTFIVNVLLKAGEQSVNSVAAYINFNPEHLEALYITPDETSLGYMRHKIDNELGQLSYTGIVSPDIEPANGMFRVAEFTFKRKVEVETTGITFNTEAPRETFIAFGEGAVLAEVVNCTIDQSDFLQPEEQPANTAEVIVGQNYTQTSQNGIGDVQNLSDVNALTHFEQDGIQRVDITPDDGNIGIVGNPVTEAGKINDINVISADNIEPSLSIPVAYNSQDGNVDALDIAMVERIIAGLEQPVLEPYIDMNHDGIINALDITLLERAIMAMQ